MQVWEAVEDEAGLTKDCENSAVEIPLISRVLEAAEMCLADVSEEPVKSSLYITKEDCKVQATSLK